MRTNPTPKYRVLSSLLLVTLAAGAVGCPPAPPDRPDGSADASLLRDGEPDTASSDSDTDAAVGEDAADGGSCLDQRPPSGPYQSLLVATTASGLEAFARDPATGRVSYLPNAMPTVFEHAFHAFVHPTGPWIYVSRGTPEVTGSIVVADVDVTTGRITPRDHDPSTPAIDGVPAGAAVRHIVIDPAGRWLIASDLNVIRTYAIDPADGGLRESSVTLPSTGWGAMSLTGGSSRLYVTRFNQNQINTFEVNATTGGLTFSKLYGDALNPQFPLAHPTLALLYVPIRSGVGVYRIETDMIRLAETAPLESGIAHPSLSPDGRSLCGVGADQVATFTVDPTDGRLSNPQTAPLAGAGTGASCVFSPDGRFVYVFVENRVATFARDMSTTALSLVAQTPTCGESLGDLVLVR